MNRMIEEILFSKNNSKSQAWKLKQSFGNQWPGNIGVKLLREKVYEIIFSSSFSQVFFLVYFKKEFRTVRISILRACELSNANVNCRMQDKTIAFNGDSFGGLRSLYVLQHRVPYRACLLLSNRACFCTSFWYFFQMACISLYQRSLISNVWCRKLWQSGLLVCYVWEVKSKVWYRCSFACLLFVQSGVGLWAISMFYSCWSLEEEEWRLTPESGLHTLPHLPVRSLS